MDYKDFILTKRIEAKDAGFNVDLEMLNPALFEFQKALTRWALAKGRAAVFADAGLGKTVIQTEWAKQIHDYTGGNVLIIAPLSIARQTVREAKNILGLDIHYSRDGIVTNPIMICNYEMVKNFDPDDYIAVVLDESSILKAIDSKTRKYLTEKFNNTPYKLCCTATPAPNDITELGNHSQFLNVMTADEMKASFFVNTGNTTDRWELRGHGERKFYRWLSSWAMFLRKPSDLGFDDTGYDLPPLTIEPIFIDTDYKPSLNGQQSIIKETVRVGGLTEVNRVRKDTLKDRCEFSHNYIKDKPGQFIVWTGLNSESTMMKKLLNGDAVEVIGSHSPDFKAESFEDFQDNKFRVLVTKLDIAGFGLNFQNCYQQVFVGMNHSFEMLYQGIRRSYRFGQEFPVKIVIVLAEAQRSIYEDVMRKQKEADELADKLISYVKEFEQNELKGITDMEEYIYEEDTVEGDGWIAMLGDSCERLKELEDDSIDLSVFSPPFMDLFTYSATERDLGNSTSPQEFFTHFNFIIRELLRVTKPGRNAAVHVADLPMMKQRTGRVGMVDFPGDVIRAFEDAGWWWYGRAFIERDPQVQAIRTHAHALMFKQFNKDSVQCRPAIADQILVFKKPGDNQNPVIPAKNGEGDNETWIQWANGVWVTDHYTNEEIEVGIYGHWHDINESGTLQYRDARDENDTKHVCPLQLDTIERCVKLWSSPGETVLSPFGGIGSEGYKAVELGRKAIIIELKTSYFSQAVKNLKRAETKRQQKSIV